MNFFKKLFNIPEKEEENHKEQEINLSLDDLFVQNFVEKGGKFLYCSEKKEVIDNLNKLKSRLNEAGNILNKLNRLKEEEDRELAAWHNDLARIKTQLIDIDKKLFE